MNIYDQINVMNKTQAAYIEAVAKRRIEELGKEKMEAVETLVSAYQSHEKINFYGQDLYITQQRYTNGGGEGEYYEWTLEKGSNIVINLD